LQAPWNDWNHLSGKGRDWAKVLAGIVLAPRDREGD